MARIHVLHDFDSPYLSGRYALKRGIQLVLYALSKKLKLLRRLSIVREVYEETRAYAETLAKLDRVAGVQAVFGLNRKVASVYPEFAEELEKYGAVTIEHWHELSGGISVSKWEPPIKQRRETWHYDQEFVAKGEDVLKLEPGEMPIFHVDYPYLLRYYVDWLYFALVEGGDIYSNNDG